MSDVILSGVAATDAKTIRSVLRGKEELVERDDLAADQAVEDVAHLQPLVVVLGSGLNGADRYDLSRKLVDLDPTIGVLIIDAPNEENMARALEAGARAVMAPESSAAEARKTFDRILSGSKRLRDHRAVAVPGLEHRTIVVVSAKGGAGKTMVSVNLATALAVAERRRTVLVDLDLQFGDVASALLLDPDHTIADAAESILDKEGKSTALKVFLTRHTPSDLFVLCGAENPAAGEEIKPQAVAAIVEELTEEFRHVVIDTPAGLGESTLAVLEMATDIVVVVDLDVASVRGARKLLETLDLIGMREPRRHVVLNRSNSKVGLRVDEVEIVLKTPLDVLLPSSRAVPLSFNRGQPLVLARPRHAYSKQVSELAARFVATSQSRRGR
ncbi:MAG TPA: AAA family ATPase [Acidimicrobiia bacterium]|nr:AAA family ATPase [Acidimicrobiia bacterium]